MLRKRWKACAIGLLSILGWNSPLHAQVAGAPAPAAAPVAGVAPAAPAAAPANLWSFLCPNPAQKEACKVHFCNSAIGKVVTASMQPVAALSGGLLTNRCALPTAADLAKPADSADGAAARIKADELAAKERRAAVRYLGTVDCSRWPEAEEALILSLRADRNECVRYEAALALSRGCCCTPKTLTALSIVVAGSDRDGFPVERSQRVMAAANAAMDHCLACLAPKGAHIGIPSGGTGVEELKEPKEVPPKEIPPVLPAPGQAKSAGNLEKSLQANAQGNQKPANVAKQAAFYQQLDPKSMAPVVQQAQKILTQNHQAQGSEPKRPGKAGGLLEIVNHAFTPTSSTGQESYSNPSMNLPGNQPSPYAPVAVEANSPKNRGIIPSLFGQNPMETYSPIVTTVPAVSGPVGSQSSPYSPMPVKGASSYATVPTTNTPNFAPVPFSNNPGYSVQPTSIDQILNDPEASKQN